MPHRIFSTISICCICLSVNLAAQDSSTKSLKEQAKTAIIKSARYYAENLNVHGGYIYFQSLDNGNRWGEGLASDTQIWVQPPGTPTVGEALVDAYLATGDSRCREAAIAAGQALVYGQLESGGWTNLVDFDPTSKSAGLYRNGKGRGKNNSSLDDDQSTAAIRFLIRLDQALELKNQAIHQAVETSLKALLNAQFPNGGFPQVWKNAVDQTLPVVSAQFPKYDWRTDNRIKNYWDLYTLNDNVTGGVAKTLLLAHQVYESEIYLARLRRLGDFLILAQLPEPQPGWAQQYDYQMRPVWARRFEPPAVSGDETQEVLDTLMLIAAVTGDKKYLKPIPSALKWINQSTQKDGQIPRYLELKTNRPLYMNRNGKNYFVTYSDKNLPDHYGWKTRSRFRELSEKFRRIQDQIESGSISKIKPSVSAKVVRFVINEMDGQGRWISTYTGGRLVGQPKFAQGERFLSSERFSKNIRLLAAYIGKED